MVRVSDLSQLRKEFNYDKDELIDSLLVNDDIRDFIIKNEIDGETISSSITKLLKYANDTFINDEGITESKSVKGYTYVLTYIDGIIDLKMKKIKNDRHVSKIKSFNLPEELLGATLEDYSLKNEERKVLYRQAKSFVDTFNKPNSLKGLYISGPFRTGKTYLASAIANEIADKGYKVVMVYYPELSSILKSSISDNAQGTFNEIVNELKESDLLVLDDLGGESFSAFIRDEALGVILNYRLIKNKKTIITSNINIEKLVDLCFTRDDNESEKLKALRLKERINEMMEEYHLLVKYEEDNKYENTIIR